MNIKGCSLPYIFFFDIQNFMAIFEGLTNHFFAASKKALKKWNWKNFCPRVENIML